MMDSAYDVEQIRLHSQRLGHVAIIDEHPRIRAGKEALKREAKAQRTAGIVSPALVPHVRYARANRRPNGANAGLNEFT